MLQPLRVIPPEEKKIKTNLNKGKVADDGASWCENERRWRKTEGERRDRRRS